MDWTTRFRLAWTILRWGAIPPAMLSPLLGADLPTLPDGQRGGPVVVDDPHPQAREQLTLSRVPDPRYPGT